MNNGVIKQENVREIESCVSDLYKNRRDLSMISNASREQNINASTVIMFHTDVQTCFSFLIMVSNVESLFFINHMYIQYSRTNLACACTRKSKLMHFNNSENAF